MAVDEVPRSLLAEVGEMLNGISIPINDHEQRFGLKQQDFPEGFFEDLLIKGPTAGYDVGFEGENLSDGLFVA